MSHVDPELTTIAECYRRGWYRVIVPGVGWQPCADGTLGALPDLARLAFFREHGYDGRWANDVACDAEARRRRWSWDGSELHIDPRSPDRRP
jgi:hypothetical protein